MTFSHNVIYWSEQTPPREEVLESLNKAYFLIKLDIFGTIHMRIIDYLTTGNMLLQEYICPLIYTYHSFQ